MEKSNAIHMERVQGGTSGMSTPPGSEDRTAREQYLLQRHGTLDLVPFPTSDPNDPCKASLFSVIFAKNTGLTALSRQLAKLEKEHAARDCLPPCLHVHFLCIFRHSSIRDTGGRVWRLPQ